ncbi:MAG: hypothetical protein KKE02_11945 [Alphaproteobacteria bacterium]|nr:hypothetical protein [Alphaproteobacteria bacterium]MBU1513987.1 hypothetical protein [Alphaproteobacteria bacterium]MBU2093073.1 hypothetical protein [Alphaproteobacteria bacterium]MBU2151724.1 hypothetical protein [Alphaproteobacteria bacterium]MBU2309456.1 hypothetical protein [Alphaproteobacteria bacterium]
MSRSLNLLIAAGVIASAPIPALAQVWPSTVVALAPQMTTASRAPALNFQRDVTPIRPASGSTTSDHAPVLKLNRATEADDIPEVEVRPKAEWSDDQGLRVGPTKLAYKSRF